MFPDDLGYTSKHEWVRRGAGNVIRVGITSYAAKELGDVVFVSLPQVGEEVAADDACAEVESTKDVSGVYTPLAGVITAVNDALTESPETINADPWRGMAVRIGGRRSRTGWATSQRGRVQRTGLGIG